MREGWEMKKLGEVCKIRPPKKEARELLNPTDEVSFAPMGDLGIGQKYFEGSSTRTLEKASGSYTYFAEGDVVLAKITPCFENGKLGIAKNLTNGIGFGSSEYIVYRPIADILISEYLYFFLDQPSIRENGARRMTGSVGHKRIPKDFYEDLQIPVPPLAVQRRIVSRLDAAFGLLDAAQANVERSLELAGEIWESVLEEKLKIPEGLSFDYTLKEITTKIGSGATPKGGQAAYKKEGIHLIRSMNVHDNDFRFKKIAFIDESQAAALSNVIVEANDVLLNITGASVARCCIVPNKALPARVNQHVSIIRPRTDTVRSEYLMNVLISRGAKNELLEIGEQGSTRQAITKKQIQDFVVVLPKTMKQQDKILETLNTANISITNLKQAYTDKLQNITDLCSSLLERAFSGDWG